MVLYLKLKHFQKNKKMKNEFEKLKVFVVGCGSIGKRHIRILYGLGVKDIMVFDSNEKQANLIKEEFPNLKIAANYDIGLQLNDIAFILTPTKIHIPMALKAVESGCHVFIEKPLSLNMDGVYELEKLANETGKKVMVGFCFRYHEGIKKAREMVESGDVGRLISIRSLVGEHFPEIRPDYKSLYYAKYSGAFELVHDLDLAIWFAGQSVKKVYSVFGSFSDIGIEAPDIVEFLMEFEDRCVATVHLDFFQMPRRRYIELIGTESVLIIEFGSWDEYSIFLYNKQTKVWESNTYKSNRDDMFRDEDYEFLEAVVHDKPIICDIWEGCKSLKVMEAIQNRITDVE